MPLAKFICPDEVEIDIADCLNKCRMGERCVTKATLLAIKQGDRKWTGTPHVTQLLNGTMLEYLKITKPYAVSPDSRAFALLGSAHHRLLELTEEDGVVVPEIPFEGKIAGTADNLEWDDDLGGYILTDYKTWGSYRVARALGIVKIGKGRDATYNRDPLKVDLKDAELQINKYKVELERTGWSPIVRLQVQVTVRDGNTFMAKNNGVNKAIYVIPIDMLSNDYINEYFAIRSIQLMSALDKGEIPVPCNDEESWNGRRCKSYCEVWNHCPKGVALHLES